MRGLLDFLNQRPRHKNKICGQDLVDYIKKYFGVPTQPGYFAISRFRSDKTIGIFWLLEGQNTGLLQRGYHNVWNATESFISKS